MAWLYRLLKTTMLKVYAGTPIANLPYLELLWPNWGARPTGRWSDQAFKYLTNPVVEVVTDPLMADYLLLPHNWNLVKNNKQYLVQWQELINKYKKTLIIFNPGDNNESIGLSSTIVFRHSQYRSRLLPNEIIMPGYVEDLGVSGIIAKPKKLKPVIGFCGWAKPASWRAGLKMTIKTWLTYPVYRRQGLWWRGRIIPKLKQSNLVDVNFIIRRSYSGNEKTIELNPIKARAEYLNNIINSDFTLCVRGDGNFSTRFYEVLSLGRLPLFIDTDCALPLEGKIDYSEIMVKVDYCDFNRVDQIASAAYQNWDEAEFESRQKKAREVFERHLRMDRFLAAVLSDRYLAEYKL